MQEHFKLTDKEFEERFANCNLKPELFSHEAHLRLAWILIEKYGLGKAEKIIQKLLQNFVAKVGEQEKYNKTLTIVAMKAVGHFMSQSKTDNFPDFIVEFPQLKSDFRQLINSHYSFDIFSDPRAKTEFLEPDLIPFQ